MILLMGLRCADKGCMQIKSRLTLLWGRDERVDWLTVILSRT